MTYRLARRAAARVKLEEVLEKSRRDSQNMGMSAHPGGVILHNSGDDPTACNAWIFHLSTSDAADQTAIIQTYSHTI